MPYDVSPGRTLRILVPGIPLAARVSLLTVIAATAFGTHPARADSIDIVPYCSNAKVARDASGVSAIFSRYPEGTSVVRWTPDRKIEFHPVVGNVVGIDAVAQGGTVAVGREIVGSIPTIGPYYRAFRWTMRTGKQILPHLVPTDYARYGPMGISGDGRVIVGTQEGYPTADSVPVRWIDGVASSPFLPLPGFQTDAGVTTTNWDGSIVWGWLSRNGNWGPFDYYRWNSSSGGLQIPKPTGFGNTDLLGVVPEADVFVGRGTNPAGSWESFFLAANGSAWPTPLPGTGEFLAFHPTADLSMILGRIGISPYLWTQTNGFRPVGDWVVHDLGLDLDGWQLTWAMGISGDGKILTLDASKLYPYPEGYVSGCAIVLVPEPHGGVAFVVGVLFVRVFGRSVYSDSARYPNSPCPHRTPVRS